MKSQNVATQFRILIRAVATALEALPLHSIDVCLEVKELIELLTKQAKKAKLELHPNDEREAKRVRSVLNQLERGTEPDVDAMKRVLDYLEIKTWTDCNNEIKFLQDESESNEQEVPLLSSLTGFMCYCRVVIFEPFNFQPEARCSTETLSCVTPDDFRCPISLELMTDPVTVSTGHTYNRASIQKWLKAGNMTCPKTGERLTNTELFPNLTLKRLIQRFCYDNGISIAKSRSRARTVEPGGAAAAHAMQFLSWFLARQLVFGTEEQKNKAAYEVRLIARSNVFNRACLAEMGMVPPLLDLLSTDDVATQENAISALLKLSKHTTGQEVIMESRGLAPIIKVLKTGHSLEARQIAAATIFYLSSVKEYRKLIGENPEAIPGLVQMIREGTTCGKKNAVVAIFGLLLLRKNRPKVLDAGAVPVLVGVLASSSDKADLVTDCLAVLVALAESVEGARAILQASALNLVIGVLQSGTSRSGKEYCVSILLSLCDKIGAEVISVLVKDPLLMPLLYSLVTDGTPLAAKKARSLINVLQEFNEKRISGLVGSSVSQQRLVHLS
ncbi:Zinc finger, RING/FYVE/PHD-type [Sesbania bispinosa]|nr:Zinc finger, RING/FYVE/PHD-type [Sesbania bispinosa]